MDNGPKKELFEYEQAWLEDAISKLSMMIENAGVIERGEIKNQMHIVEKIRASILQEFFKKLTMYLYIFFMKIINFKFSYPLFILIFIIVLF